MKHLPKNQNIYVFKNNKIYIDFFKKGEKRIRKSTGLKYSPLAMDFVRKHYDDFCALEKIERKYGSVEKKIRLKALQNKYYQIENKEVEKKLNEEEALESTLRRKSLTRKSLNMDRKNSLDGKISEKGFERDFEKAYEKNYEKMGLKGKDFKENKQIEELRKIEYSFLSMSEILLKEKAFLKESTYKSYQYLIKQIISFLHKNKLYYVSDFKREHSFIFYEYFQNKVSASTLSIYCFLMKNFFTYALENDFLIKNPFFIPKTKQKLKTKKESFEVFNLEEAINLIKNAQGDLRTFLILAFFTGARTGELFALKWEDLDFEKNEIHIYKTLSRYNKIDSPKTKNSNRVIDMLPLLKSELEALKENRELGGFVIEKTRNHINKAYHQLLKELGYKKRRLYDTRHSFASIMLSKGEEPLWVGCKMLGHKDLNETYKSYAKYLPKPVVQRAGFLSEVDLARA